MKIFRTAEFQKGYINLPKKVQSQVDKKLAIFLANPFHPSLGVKKMQGYENIWEGRVTKNYRFIFQIVGDGYILRKIGCHDILKNP